MDADLRTTFAQQGFVVLRRCFDAAALAAEVDRALADGFGPADRVQTFMAGNGSVTLRYVPMMNERCGSSTALVAQLSTLAASVLGRAVLPGRAKATRYYGSTSWHRDSEHPVQSVGFVAYLDDLSAAEGALRVVPGSHLDPDMPLPPEGADSGLAVESAVGDVIAFDEHLIHGSRGGRERRQWRSDFVIDPTTDEEITAVRRWYEQVLTDGADDPGYDARRHPSFGGHWRTHHPAWTSRLVEIGALPTSCD